MPTAEFKHLLVTELKDLYHAEGQLTKALPRMAKAAQHEPLRQALEDHLRETEEQIRRLDAAFEKLDVSPKGKTCVAMKGLVEEGVESFDARDPSPLRDTWIIAAAQKIEHYEIAAYGTVRTLARKLGEEDLAELLQLTLNEEGEADRRLSALADAIYAKALNALSTDESK